MPTQESDMEKISKWISGIGKWIVGIGLFLAALFFATQSRKHENRANTLVDEQVQKQREGKQSSLQKADKLGKKIGSSARKAQEAKTRSEDLLNELENRNETTLAQRVRDFNSSV